MYKPGSHRGDFGGGTASEDTQLYLQNYSGDPRMDSNQQLDRIEN